MVDDSEPLLALIHADKKLFCLYILLDNVKQKYPNKVGLYQSKIIRHALDVVRTAYSRGGITKQQIIELENLEEKGKAIAQ